MRLLSRSMLVPVIAAFLSACGRIALMSGPLEVNESPCHVVGAAHAHDNPALTGSIAVDSSGNLYVISVFGSGAAPKGRAPASVINVYSKSDIDRSPATNRVTAYGTTQYYQDPTTHVKPIRTIYLTWQGPTTLPLALDGARNIYALDVTRKEIVVFDDRASGHAAPSRTIGGQRNGLHAYDLAVDRSGSVFVASGPYWSHGQPTGRVLIFGPSQHGDIAPARMLAGGHAALIGLHGIAVAEDGSVAVSGGGSPYWPTPYYINVYPPRATGNVAPVRQIAGARRVSDDMMIAQDSPAWAKASRFGIGDPAAVQYEPRNEPMLNGNRRMGFDRAGTLWVANIGVFRVTEYSPSANGNVKPMLVLQGDKTGLSEPAGIAVDGEGNVFVSNYGTGTVNEYCGLEGRVGFVTQ